MRIGETRRLELSHLGSGLQASEVECPLCAVQSGWEDAGNLHPVSVRVNRGGAVTTITADALANTDEAAEGRAAGGNRNGAYTHPESRTYGDRNGYRLHPERYPSGEDHPNAKLTMANVRAMRIDWDGGRTTKTALSRKYNVCRATVIKILTRKTYKETATDI